MQFTKYTGLGNDFIVLDGATALAVKEPRSLARSLCNRRWGIGADGLVLLLPSEKADVRMQIINSDGSEAEMCGNASRCVALHLFRRGVVPHKQISLDTLAGVIYTEIKDEEKGWVCVNMGKPRLTRGEIPLQGKSSDRAIAVPIQVGNDEVCGTGVSMGNPHFVVFVSDLTKIALEELGPQIETHPLFPRKTNVELVQILDDKTVRMRVWERGAGITQACGTGSCAALVAGVLNGKTPRELTVKLDGGDLLVSWPEADGPVFMTGPAQEVFTGNIND